MDKELEEFEKFIKNHRKKYEHYIYVTPNINYMSKDNINKEIEERQE